MKLKILCRGLLLPLVVLLLPVPAFAVSITATINVTIARFLSITNISPLEFGTISVSSTPGSISINTNGVRLSTGGVTINPSENISPAIFIIEGKPDANFTIALPNSVELRDSSGSTLHVNQFQSTNPSGNLDASGSLEIKVGGTINLNADQKSGDYSGVMLVELNYS